MGRMNARAVKRIAESWRDSVAAQVGGLEALRGALEWPDGEAVYRVALCRAPAPGEDLETWAAQVGEYAGVEAGKLLALAQAIREGKGGQHEAQGEHDPNH